MNRNILFIFFIISVGTFGQNPNADIKNIFGSHPGAAVIYNTVSQKYVRINEKRCAEKVLPASTFKIPNSIIGLETGVITDENFVIKWDGVKRAMEEWNKDNTLSSAIKFSVVPYYQEVARRVGKEKMQKYLNEFDYGNKIIGNRIDTFWLDNSLKVSPDEQIEFLRKFYFYELPASKRSIDIVKNIMSYEEYPNSILKYKTGGGQKEDGSWLGWLVGYIEQKNINIGSGKNVFLFAINVEGQNFKEISNLRMNIAKNIFHKLNLID